MGISKTSPGIGRGRLRKRVSTDQAREASTARSTQLIRLGCGVSNKMDECQLFSSFVLFWSNPLSFFFECMVFSWNYVKNKWRNALTQTTSLYIPHSGEGFFGESHAHPRYTVMAELEVFKNISLEKGEYYLQRVNHFLLYSSLVSIDMDIWLAVLWLSF